ncbi:MAG: hypothetical protein V4864_20320 [Pseudomonadota bacterium]
MPRTLPLLVSCLLLAPLPGAAAQQDDPLKSPACGQALQLLQAAREAPDAGAARVESLRRDAARTCLGTGGPPARPARLAQPPVAVPPPAIEPPPRTAQRVPPAPPPPPVTVARPPMVTTCDTGGCWTSDGTRLQRAGPNLVGPQGVCTVQGALAFCP